MMPGQWLTAYFQTRAHLAAAESDFCCDPACTRPGCKNPYLQVPVSLVDLLGAALHQDGSVSTPYRRHYSLGLLAEAQHEWLRKVSLKLQKPCPFLENDLCGIYPVRPLACILFPEYLVAEGRFEAEAGKEHFRDFLCMRSPIPLSPQRAAIMARLKRMWTREMLVSGFYLFGHGRCYLDFGNLPEELLQIATTLRNAELKERPEPEGTIPHEVLEHFFHERIAGSPPFAGVSAKINHLDSQEGQVEFLQLLQDEQLIRKLLRSGDDRAMVFQFVKGKLKGKRRSLIPREYQFY